MDTDYLTPMAYDSIIIASEASDFLKTDLGVACGRYLDEDAYLRGILKIVEEVEEDPLDYLDSWNIIEETDMAIFIKKIKILKEHIQKTIATPIKDRGEPPF